MKEGITGIVFVSDEIHIEKVRVLFDAIMGDEYKIHYLGSKVNLAGQYRDLIAQNEATKTQYVLDNMVEELPRGDHEEYRRYDKEYRAAQVAHNESGGDPNKPVNMKEWEGVKE
ncbi:MAG: hypothetical protein ACOCXP_00170 [Candidatus Dojkabacteria bacterium]